MFRKFVISFMMMSFAFILTSISADAQTWQALGDVPVYKYHRPGAEDPDNPTVATVEHGKVVKELDRYKFWIKLNVNGNIGWASKHCFEKVAGENYANLVVVNFNSVDRRDLLNVFITKIYIRNDGEADYIGTTAINLYQNSNFLDREKAYLKIPAGQAKVTKVDSLKRPTKVKIEY